MKKNNSTGPRTANGKARSARNAVRHGLLALSPVVIAFEQPEAWKRHLEGILKACDPVGHLEAELAQRIALTLWRLARIAHYEAENIQMALVCLGTPGLIGVPTVSQVQNRALLVELGEGPSRELTAEECAHNRGVHQVRDQRDERAKYLLSDEKIALINRYESHLERSLYRAVQELERLQERRISLAGPMRERQSDSNVLPQTNAISERNP
jgi:hypothetical protein